MKKIISTSLIIVLTLVAFSSCNLTTKPTEAQVNEVLTIRKEVMTSSETEGQTATTVESVKTITYTDYDVSSLVVDDDYTSMSGTIKIDISASTMTYDLTFKGGVIETLYVSADTTKESMTVTANGYDFTISE